MKILLVIDQFDSGINGTTISAQRFARALRGLGHEVRVLASGKPAQDKYALPAVQWLPIAQSIISSQGMQFAVPVRTTLQRALEWADLVHFMMPFHLSRKAMRMARRMQKPCTAAFHVQPENITSTLKLGHAKRVNDVIYTEFRNNFYNHFTHLHCPSKFIADQLTAHGYTAKLHVISNGVGPQFCYRRMEKEPRFAGKFVILMIGRLSEEKRQDVLMKAVARSAHAGDIQLILAGQGPRRRALEQLGAALPNPPIFGFYSTQRLCDVIAMSDLYVHTADVEIEAIACIEAFACGLVPVIADSPLSATPQFALDERSLFPVGDAGALARKIDWWIDHPDERARMGRAYARSADQYRLEHSVKLAEEMFYEALEEHAYPR